MKRLLLFILLAAALGFAGLLPFERRDVAALEPLEALVVSENQDYVVLDGGSCRGLGRTFSQALEDLHKSGEGTVFLGTVSQVILADSAVKLLPEVVKTPELRPAAALTAARGMTPDPEAAAAYLSAHHPGLTIQQMRTAIVRGQRVTLPVLAETEGGLRLYAAAHR